MGLRKRLWVIAWHPPAGLGLVRVFATEGRSRVDAVKLTEAFLLAPAEEREVALGNPRRWLESRSDADLEAFERASADERLAWGDKAASLIGVRQHRTQPELLCGHQVVELDFASDREWARALVGRVQQERDLHEHMRQRVEAGFFGIQDALNLHGRWASLDEMVFQKRETTWILCDTESVSLAPDGEARPRP